MPYQSNASRRQLLKLLGASGVSIWSAGCKKPSPDGKQDKEAPAPPTSLRLYGTGTLDIGADKWKQAKADANIDLRFTDNKNDTGPVITQMTAGTAARDYDLGGLQGGAERELAEAGAIVPWDTAKLTNWSKLWPFAREIPYTTHNGKLYGIPSVINADSMIYLPEKVGTIDSYGAIFDPKLKGRTAMEDAWINSVIFAAIYLKESGATPIVNPGDLEESELGFVMEFLIKKKRDKQFRTLWSGWEHGLKLITTGEVHVMTGWEPIVYAAQKQKVNAQYAVPREGYEGWSNDLLLHIGAKERNVIDAAHRFADWELSGYYGCELRQQRGYVVPSDLNSHYASDHPTQFNAADQKSVEAHVLTKFETMKGKTYWQNVRPRNYVKYEEWWSKLRSA